VTIDMGGMLHAFTRLLAQQQAAMPDTTPLDSIAAVPELPSPELRVVRFMFNDVPQWVQIGGVVIAAIVGIVLAVLVWRNRVAIGGWFGAKSRAWKLGFAAITLVVVAGVGFAGLSTWNYMMHDNEFCSGCHIMGEPFQRFGTSEHAKLNCHDCHQQSIFASMWELYVQVMERPTEIPAHRGVPNEICSGCHVRDDPDSTWQRVVATAGHQVHLNPASPVMSQVECITCHGLEVHRFRPVAETCAQSGCHDDIRVELGSMAQQTDLHCTVCHEFTVPATEGLPVDSSRATFAPGEQQCLGCHAMRERLLSFAPEDEPHGAKCASCHNAHVQTTAAGAYQSCATSGCHAQSDTLTAMHRSLGSHRLQTCGACHAAHTWTANAVDCRSCHTGINDPAVRTRPPGAAPGSVMPHPAGVVPLPVQAAPAPGAAGPLPTESPHPARAPRAVAPSAGGDVVLPIPSGRRPALDLLPASWSGSRKAGAAPELLPAGRLRWRPPAPDELIGDADPGARQSQGRDTLGFEHARHESVSCTTCHSTATGHGTLRVSVARDCQGCHHANNTTGRDCARCHTTAEIRPVRQVTTQVALTVWPAPRQRSLPFAHERHVGVECAACHGLDRARPMERTCESCHADHHQARVDCASCHPPAQSTHTRALHQTGCGTSGCHAAESTPAVTPVRGTCLACHAEQRDHMANRECAGCHLSAWSNAAARQPDGSAGGKKSLTRQGSSQAPGPGPRALTGGGS
jgi:nitrate/TMAO reductase-like tetraheme cytochrome c subunit